MRHHAFKVCGIVPWTIHDNPQYGFCSRLETKRYRARPFLRILINIKQKKKEIHKEGQQSTCCLHIGAKIDQHEFYYFVVYNQCCKLIPHANIMNTWTMHLTITIQLVTKWFTRYANLSICPKHMKTCLWVKTEFKSCIEQYPSLEDHRTMREQSSCVWIGSHKHTEETLLCWAKLL